jgi:hypothetical protein
MSSHYKQRLRYKQQEHIRKLQEADDLKLRPTKEQVKQNFNNLNKSLEFIETNNKKQHCHLVRKNGEHHTMETFQQRMVIMDGAEWIKPKSSLEKLRDYLNI